MLQGGTVKPIEVTVVFLYTSQVALEFLGDELALKSLMNSNHSIFGGSLSMSFGGPENCSTFCIRTSAPNFITNESGISQNQFTQRIFRVFSII